MLVVAWWYRFSFASEYELNLAFVSHAHADHLGGLPSVLEPIPFGDGRRTG